MVGARFFMMPVMKYPPSFLFLQTPTSINRKDLSLFLDRLTKFTALCQEKRRRLNSKLETRKTEKTIEFEHS